jgi:hypothetical protein
MNNKKYQYLECGILFPGEKLARRPSDSFLAFSSWINSLNLNIISLSALKLLIVFQE